MSEHDTAEVEGTDLEPRTRRALERAATVLHTDGTPIREGDDPTIVSVVSGNSGREHTVDVREERCTCEDHRHRGAECYHLRRAKIALGVRVLDTRELEAADVDSHLAVNAPGPVVATSDGGVEVAAGDGAELIDADEPAEWDGPHREYDRYGRPTGEEFVRCPECGIEVLEQHTDRATHADGCGFEEAGQ